MIRVASERSIEPSLYSRVIRGSTRRATNGRAVLHFATQSLLSRNDLVWHYLVYGATRVLDRVSESLFTLGVET